MQLVVYAEGSEGSNPGHMVLGQEGTASPRYVGFRFDPANLPDGYRPREKWRDYLFTHAVAGKIVDETDHMQHLLKHTDRKFRFKAAACEVLIESKLPPAEEWNPHAWYSFNPDDDHSGCQPCYNCVKWAITIANALIEDFLQHVRHGRVKLILEQLAEYNR